MVSDDHALSANSQLTSDPLPTHPMVVVKAHARGMNLKNRLPLQIKVVASRLKDLVTWLKLEILNAHHSSY